MPNNRSSLLVLLLVIVPRAQGWATTKNTSNIKKHLAHVEQQSATTVSRRWLLQTSLLTGLLVPSHAAQASDLPSATELERLQLGHARVRYLLDHWDAVTEICGTTIMSDTERRQVIRTEGGSICSKTPLRVQEFLGYKSVTDPLYRADKLMVRAGQLVDPENFENYLDAVERYREKADQSALLAYTSSWGEANPNGSKEVIEDYLEQTREQVVESERFLKQILNYLKLPTLPPLQGKL